jgi:hypothetical protein
MPIPLTGLADGDPVSTFTDRTALTAGFVASSTARPLYKTNIINGRPVLRFDGVNDAMTCALAYSQPATILVVAEMRNGGRLIDGANNPSMAFTAERSGNVSTYAGSFVDVAQSLPTGMHLWTLIFNGASSSIRKDGTQVSTANPGTNAQTTSRIGSIWNSTGFSDADVAEFVVYSHALTTTELATVEGLLRTKYGL